MAGSQLHAEMQQAALELIVCQRQPGHLRISKHACALRYLMAKKGKSAFPNDEFGMAWKAGLDICRDCPEGRVHAEALKKE
jgi:hypothetical protein